MKSKILHHCIFCFFLMVHGVSWAESPNLTVGEWLQGFSSGEALPHPSDKKWVVDDEIIVRFLKERYGLVNVIYGRNSRSNKQFVACRSGGAEKFVEADLAINFIYISEQRLIEEMLPRRYPGVINNPGQLLHEKMQWLEKNCPPDLVVSYGRLLGDFRIALDDGVNAKKNIVKKQAEEKRVKLNKEQIEREGRNKNDQQRFSQISAQASQSRIVGYQDFKFGMNAVDVKNLQGKACKNFAEFAEDDRWLRLVGQNCYEVGGKSRPIVFYFESGIKGPLLDISILLGDYSPADERQVIKALSEKYGAADFFPNQEIRDLFNNKMIDRLALAAFKDWSVVYIVERKNNGGVATMVRYGTDSEAARIKSNHLGTYKKFSNGNFLAQPGKSGL